MMPRGVTPTRVRRRQSDAKWRASVAMCYNIMKHVIPNQRKFGRRKISKALTLKETERHLMNLERALKELLVEKARMYGKTVMIPKENNILKTATFEDVRNDYDDRQLHFFSSNTASGKKRYNVPTDVEASLDHLSLQSCPLVVLNRGDARTQQPAVASEKMVKIEQDGPPPELKSGSKLESLLTTPHGCSPKFHPHVVKPAGFLPKTPSKGRCKAETVIRLKIGSLTPARATSSQKPESTPGKSSRAKVDSLKTPSKACKQLPFSQASGFTPIKLPFGLDGAPDNLNSFPSTPARSVFGSAIGSPFSGFSLPQTPNSCFNGVEYFDATNDDNNSLLCTETIDNLDLDDVINTPPGPVRDWVKTETTGSAVRSKLDTPNRTPSVRDPEETETDESLVKNTQERYGDDFGLRKIKSAKCRRRLDRSYQLKETSKPEALDENCNEFDGFLLFYDQNAGEIKSENSFEDKAVTVARMWKSLAADDRAAYTKIASLDNSNDSIHLSDDLRSLDLKPLSKMEQEGVLDIDPEGSAHVVPDLDLQVPDLDLQVNLFTRNSEAEYELVPEYADLGIIYNENIEKEVEIIPRKDTFKEEDQVVPDVLIAQE